MDAEAQEFFRAGLREYGHAWRAVAELKAELVRTLQDALQRKEQRSPGSVLVLADEPKFVTSAGALETPAKPYISVFATIKDPRAASDGQKLGEEGLTGELGTRSLVVASLRPIVRAGRLFGRIRDALVEAAEGARWVPRKSLQVLREHAAHDAL